MVSALSIVSAQGWAGNSGELKAVVVPGAGGVGDVIGPGSSTDNAIPRFDGTTGKLLQNSSVLISDTNNISGADNVSMNGVLNFLGNDTVANGGYTIQIDPSANLHFNAPPTLHFDFSIGGNTQFNFSDTAAWLKPDLIIGAVSGTPDAALHLKPSAVIGGSHAALKIEGAAHIQQTASVESPDLDINLTRTVQFLEGGLNEQRAFRLTPPIYTFTGPSYLANTSTFSVTGAPSAGTNTTIGTSAVVKVGDFYGRSSSSFLNSGLQVVPPGLANGIGATTLQAGIMVSAGGTNVTLGNQTEGTNIVAPIYIDAIPYDAEVANRLAFAGASLYIAGPPSNAGNVVFGDGPYSLYLAAGDARFNGRVLGAQGANVASASTITLGNGNYFSVTGTNTIDCIVGTGWTAGSEVVLDFAGVLTVTDSSGGCAGADKPINIGAAFTSSADDTLTLIYNGTAWKETARSVN